MPTQTGILCSATPSAVPTPTPIAIPRPKEFFIFTPLDYFPETPAVSRTLIAGTVRPTTAAICRTCTINSSN